MHCIFIINGNELVSLTLEAVCYCFGEVLVNYSICVYYETYGGDRDSFCSLNALSFFYLFYLFLPHCTMKSMD